MEYELYLRRAGVEVGDVELGVSDRGMRSDGLDFWEMDGGEMDRGISELEGAATARPPKSQLQDAMT